MPAGPPWFKLDCNFADNPKLQAVGIHAAWAYLRGIGYCMSQMTDGAIPYSVARKFASPLTLKRLTTRQEGQRSPLWLITGSGYLVHDYLKHQKSRETILRAREKTAARVAKCSTQTNAVTNAV